MQNLFAVKVIQKLSAFFYHATACNATHGIAKAFFSVCLSVKHVLCDETKESSADFLIPHERSFMGRPTVPVFFLNFAASAQRLPFIRISVARS